MEWRTDCRVGGAALFLDLSVFAPFLIGGVTLSGLGKLSPSSLLFALCT